MNSPTIQTLEWYDHLSDIYRQDDNVEIPGKLALALQYLSRGDSILIMVYFPARRPALLYADIDHKCRKNNFKEYLQGIYLLDPFYQMSAECKAATLCRLKDIFESGFYDSEYYESWYRQSGLIDEVNYLIPMDENAVVALSLSRNIENAPFSAYEVGQLETIKPLVTVIMKGYWANRYPPSVEEENYEQGLHGALCKAMENFGRSLLTNREVEIVQFLLRGYNIKATALKLGISPATIKVHRKHIYRKLDITSHSELFSLFIDALSVVKTDGSEDPLLGYTP